VFACANIGKWAKHITVKDSTSLAPISRVAGGRRYSFNVDGQLNLVTICSSDQGRHAFVSGSTVAGPNVWVHSTATNEFSDGGPHMRWSYGQLYDNIKGRQFRAWDCSYMGSGHGWSGNTIVFYNCEAIESDPPGAAAHRRRRNAGFIVSSPFDGVNYCIGCKSDVDAPNVYDAKTPNCCGVGGHFQGQGQLRTDIPSLYDMQLAIQKRHMVTSAR